MVPTAAQIAGRAARGRAPRRLRRRDARYRGPQPTLDDEDDETGREVKKAAGPHEVPATFADSLTVRTRHLARFVDERR